MQNIIFKEFICMSEQKTSWISYKDPKNVLNHDFVNCSLKFYIFRNEYSFIKLCERN